VESIHEVHLERGWQGIGYHFLIGNGKGLENGAIEPTFRWREQLHGAHAGQDEYNQHGIGICLVGNFETSYPTAAQLAAVKRLVGVLKSAHGISSEHVIAHKDVKNTACPGKNFPLAEVGQTVAIPTLVQFPVVPLARISQGQHRQWQQMRAVSPVLDGSLSPVEHVAQVQKPERRQRP
jgi:N-acetyl-anhydromuramyl-L-alanine amidase AmpD